MRRTEQTTRLGTFRVRRGRWHRMPYVVSSWSSRGLTRAGWLVGALVLVLLLAVVVVEDLVP